MVKLQLLNSHMALILRSVLSGNATSIFLFRQYFLSIPRDLENAAIIDGCSWRSVFFRIILPNSKPAIATVIILTFRTTWNAFLWPQLVLQDDKLWTWTLALKILSEFDTDQTVFGVHDGQSQKVILTQRLGSGFLVVQRLHGDEILLHDVADDVIVFSQQQGADTQHADQMPVLVHHEGDVDGFLVGAGAADAL